MGSVRIPRDALQLENGGWSFVGMSRYYSKTGGGWAKRFDVPIDVLCYLLALSHLQLENGGYHTISLSSMPLMTRRRWRNDGNAVGVVSSKSAPPPPPSSSYDGNVGWIPSLRVLLIRVDRTHSHWGVSGTPHPIHTLGGVICYAPNHVETNIRLQFHLVYSSEFTGPLYFDVTESPSRHCQ